MRRVSVVALVLVGLGTSGIVCQRIAARGRYAVPYSTYGAGPEGTKALYVYAEQAGLSPRRWSQDLVGLPEGALLVAIGGCDQAPNRELSRYEVSALSEWIEAGGVLMVAGAHDYLWDEAGIAIAAPEGCIPEGSLAAELARAERGEEPEEGREEELAERLAADPEEVVDQLLGVREEVVPELAETSGVLEGLGMIPLSLPGKIWSDEDVEVFLGIGKPAEPHGVILRRGEGAIVIVSSASLLQNRDLEGASGGVVFARLVEALAPAGPVIFDEYHLGVGERRSLGRYVRDVGGGALVLQLLAVVGFALLAFGVRFGRPIKAVPPVPGGTASFVEGIGALYARTSDAAAALSLVAKQALAEVAAHHHVGSIDPARLATLLGERGRRDAAEAVRRLGVLSASGDVNARGLVDGVQEIDGLVARAKGNEG